MAYFGKKRITKRKTSKKRKGYKAIQAQAKRLASSSRGRSAIKKMAQSMRKQRRFKTASMLYKMLRG